MAYSKPYSHRVVRNSVEGSPNTLHGDHLGEKKRWLIECTSSDLHGTVLGDRHGPYYASVGGSISILLQNAILESAVELSPQSDDPSSCQLFQYLQCAHRGCFFQDVFLVRPLLHQDQKS